MAGVSAEKLARRRALARRWALVERLCARVAAGESVAAVCRDPTFPPRTTMIYWMASEPALRRKLEDARAACPEARRVYHRWSEEIADEVLARVEAGRGVAEVCAEGDMPAAQTVFRWLSERPRFAQAYQQAKERQADTLFDLAWRIACEADEAEVKSARLKIDTIKWRVARLAPRVYGPWKAVAPPEEEGEAEPEVVFYTRQWAGAPDGRVMEISDIVHHLDREQVKAVHRAVEAGRFREGPDGKLAEVFWEDGADGQA